MIYPKEVTDQEARRLAEPAALASIILSFLLILAGFEKTVTSTTDYLLVFLGILGILYAMTLFYFVMPSIKFVQILKWPILISNTLAVSAGVYFLNGSLLIVPLLIMVLISIVTLVFWDRNLAYLFIALSGVLFLLISIFKTSPAEILNQSVFFVTAVIFVETVERLYASNQKHVIRLQAINDFARHVSASLEVDEVIDLIGTAIKSALQADTYFFGLMDGDQLNMLLIFDKGHFFPPESVPLKGSLSGWVIRNQQSLFIADLRNEVELEDVSVVLLGHDETSLCWMGVSLHARHLDGIIAVASYKPNDFSRTDLELLENLAQQSALVLDNAYQHSEVQAQSKLDSLTGVYNHGHIVKVLNSDARHCAENGMPLCLIMLDIDYFKQYNDNFGHVVGDQVLTNLTLSIREHIKVTDSIGRWGGEEFTIILPGTSALQALQVAERIQETVSSLTILDRDGNLLPFPTVSQGLAIFPQEATDVFKLIDLADQRLYTAKVRGRNQIEPKSSNWDQI